MHLTTLLSASLFLAGSFSTAAPLESRQTPGVPAPPSGPYVSFTEYTGDHCQGSTFGFNGGPKIAAGGSQGFDLQAGGVNLGPISVKATLMNGYILPAAAREHITLTAFDSSSWAYVPGQDLCWQAPGSGSRWKSAYVPPM